VFPQRSHISGCLFLLGLHFAAAIALRTTNHAGR
jgi:hypothetical protein